jgi:hypothetical protein
MPLLRKGDLMAPLDLNELIRLIQGASRPRVIAPQPVAPPPAPDSSPTPDTEGAGGGSPSALVAGLLAQNPGRAGLLAAGQSLLSEQPGLVGMLGRAITAGTAGAATHKALQAQKTEQEKQARLQAEREALFDHFQSMLGENPSMETLQQVLPRMVPQLLRIGDSATAKAITEYLDKLKPGDKYKVAGDRLFDPQTGLDPQGNPVTPAEKAPVFDTVTTPSGEQFKVALDPQTGKERWRVSLGKRPDDPTATTEKAIGFDLRLGSAFDQAMRPYFEEADKYERVMAMADAAEGNPAAQNALILAYLKMNGIQAVRSPAILKLVRGAEGIPHRITTQIENWVKGTQLDSGVVNDIREAVRRTAAPLARRTARIVQDFKARGSRIPGSTFEPTDPFEFVMRENAPPPPEVEEARRLLGRKKP